MRVTKADKPSQHTCATCGARLTRQLHVDAREDLWCPTCETVRGTIVTGGGARGQIIAWQPRPGEG